jgi:Uma2 family endonuclease
MPTSAAAVVNDPLEMEPRPRRKRFTREQVSAMLDAGVFAGERFELIDGELIDKMGQNPPHASAIADLNSILTDLYGTRRIRIQMPIRVGGEDDQWNEPEPDLAVLAAGRTANDFRREHPRATDLELVVEVADSTLRYDTTRKRELYARAGVPLFWVLDISAMTLHVFSDPSNGSYQNVQRLDATQAAELAGSTIPVASMISGLES